MLCKKCGATIAENSKFCEFCGEAVNKLNQNVQSVNSGMNGSLLNEVPTDTKVVKEEMNNSSIKNDSSLNIFENVNAKTSSVQPITQNNINVRPSTIQPINKNINPAKPVVEMSNIGVINNEVKPAPLTNNNVSVENIPNTLKSPVEKPSMVSNTIPLTNENNVSVENISSSLKTSVETSSMINNSQPINNEVKSTLLINENTSTVQPTVETPVGTTTIPYVSVEGSSNKKTKKSNKMLFVIMGVVLGVVAIVLLCFSFFKGSRSNVSVLQKAVANFQPNIQNSFTINANLTAIDDNNKEFSFDALIKSQKKSEDETNMQILVNKTELFDEINSYLVLNKDKVELYLQSTLVDLLGLTSSLEPIWIYNSIDLKELDLDDIKAESTEKISLEQIIDEEHFILIDKVDGVRHYQLVIDQKLIDNIKVKFADSENESIKSIIESDTTIENPIKIDFYISNSDQIEKIEINLLDYLGADSGFSKLLLAVKFSNFNNTVVKVPNEVKTGIYDLETYMATHAVEFNIDYGSNAEF